MKQIFVSLYVAFACAAISHVPPARAADTKAATINIDNFTFEPAVLTVTPGTKVTWLNRDDIPHAIASTTKLFRSSALDTDQSYTFTFATPGDYDYFCSLHPHMKGKIVVKAEAAK